MTGSRHHAADDGSLARSTGGAAARGAMLIALAVVIGLVLLAFVLDDPATVVDATDSTEQTTDGDTDANTGDTGSQAQEPTGDEADEAVITDSTEAPVVIPDETTTIPPGDTRVPAEVRVLVANGTGGRGVAGAVSDQLIARGYISDAANAPNTQDSTVFYREGYSSDAVAVATVLGATPDIVMPAPEDGQIGVAASAIDDGRLAASNVVVIVGTDGRIPTG
jgi:hypothetical protein